MYYLNSSRLEDTCSIGYVSYLHIGVYSKMPFKCLTLLKFGISSDNYGQIKLL